MQLLRTLSLGRSAAPLLLLCACLAACRSGPALDGAGVLEVASSDPERPLLRYPDGQLTALPHCAIQLANRLNPKIPPCYLNGAPVGFC